MDYKEYIKDCMGSEHPKNSVEEAYKVFPAFMKQDTEEGKKENATAPMVRIWIRYFIKSTKRFFCLRQGCI